MTLKRFAPMEEIHFKTFCRVNYWNAMDSDILFSSTWWTWCENKSCTVYSLVFMIEVLKKKKKKDSTGRDYSLSSQALHIHRFSSHSGIVNGSLSPPIWCHIYRIKSVLYRERVKQMVCEQHHGNAIFPSTSALNLFACSKWVLLECVVKNNLRYWHQEHPRNLSTLTTP